VPQYGGGLAVRAHPLDLDVVPDQVEIAVRNFVTRSVPTTGVRATRTLPLPSEKLVTSAAKSRAPAPELIVAEQPANTSAQHAAVTWPTPRAGRWHSGIGRPEGG
jgi:hypothetical protein